MGGRVITELVEPFREVEIDDEEFACLKAIVFFDPNVPGLTKSDEVRKVRKQVQVLEPTKLTSMSLFTPFFLSPGQPRRLHRGPAIRSKGPVWRVTPNASQSPIHILADDPPDQRG